MSHTSYLISFTSYKNCLIYIYIYCLCIFLINIVHIRTAQRKVKEERTHQPYNNLILLTIFNSYTRHCPQKYFQVIKISPLKTREENFLSKWWKFLIPITLNETKDLIKTNWCCCHVALMFSQVFRCLPFLQIKD